MTFLNGLGTTPEGEVGRHPAPEGQEEHMVRTRFLADQIFRGHSEATVSQREYVIRKWEESLSPRSMMDATKEDVERFCDRPGVWTRSWYVSNLSVFYQWAIREELVSSDPTARVPRPKLPKRQPRPADSEDITAGMAEADIRLRAMIALAAYAGLRAKEIAQLHWRDVDFDNAEVWIRDGKGGKDGVVPLPDQLVRVLVEYGIGVGWVFPSQRGDHLSRQTVSQYVCQFFASRNMEARTHRLRHSYGTNMYRLLGDIVAVQELMRHDDISTTRGYVRAPERVTNRVRAFAY